MDIYGRIIHVLPQQSGVSKNGKDWKKQSYVIKTYEMYPKEICFEVFGDKIEYFQIKQEEDVTVCVDVTSHEYNGKWYTSVTAWNVIRGDRRQVSPQQVAMQQPPAQQPQQQAQQVTPPEESKLPF